MSDGFTKNIYKSNTKELVCHSGYVVGSNFRKMYLKWYEEKFNLGKTFNGNSENSADVNEVGGATQRTEKNIYSAVV